MANRDSRPETTLPIWETGSCSLSFFVGKDVAKALEYSNTRDAIGKHVDNEDKGVVKCDTLGGSQDLSVINESGLYSLILSSKLPQAKAFKRWVTSEVLPQIRKKRKRTGHSCRQRGKG
ncbi:MAG: Bro-N domain-containing protein [Prevotella sp.]|nr:Bro-N domain-containing protein [Prevotella sp.]